MMVKNEKMKSRKENQNSTKNNETSWHSENGKQFHFVVFHLFFLSINASVRSGIWKMIIKLMATMNERNERINCVVYIVCCNIVRTHVDAVNAIGASRLHQSISSFPTVSVSLSLSFILSRCRVWIYLSVTIVLWSLCWAHCIQNGTSTKNYISHQRVCIYCVTPFVRACVCVVCLLRMP